jgi:hypothetical protein
MNPTAKFTTTKAEATISTTVPGSKSSDVVIGVDDMFSKLLDGGRDGTATKIHQHDEIDQNKETKTHNFIPSKQYNGPKVGYIFTTRQPNGSGYYFDIKVQHQKQHKGISITNTTITTNIEALDVPDENKERLTRDFIPSKQYIGTKVGYVYTSREPNGTGYYRDTKVLQQEEISGTATATVSKIQESDELDENKELLTYHFIESKQYNGTKIGYIYTTRQPHGTGYYLDTNVQQYKQPQVQISTASGSRTTKIQEPDEPDENKELPTHDFIPSTHYSGPKIGYIYTTRYPNGIGYYLDTVLRQKQQQDTSSATEISISTPTTTTTPVFPY